MIVVNIRSMNRFVDNRTINKGKVHKLLKERIEKANPRRNLTAEETKRLNKLEAIADKL